MKQAPEAKSIVYVGQSWGKRDVLRQEIARRYRWPIHRIHFREVPDWQATPMIVVNDLRSRFALVLTFSDASDWGVWES